MGRSQGGFEFGVVTLNRTAQLVKVRLPSNLDGRGLVHPFVVGAVALGHIRNRDQVLRDLQSLPAAVKARDDEVAALIDREKLHGKNIGYIDAHLIASTRLTADTTLWTRDRRLLAVSHHLRLAANLMQ